MIPFGTWTSLSNSVALTPQDPVSFCTPVGGDGASVTQYRIDGVPYEYAVPVLSGWELGYPCGDHHVRDFGMEITDFRYERSQTGTSGTLYYTVSSRLTDDEHNVSYRKPSVDVLGLVPMQQGTHPIVTDALAMP